METFLQRLERERRERLEAERQRMLGVLRDALGRLVPGQRVYVYGSVIRPGRFHDRSDVDLALVEEPSGRSLYGLMADLTDALGRPVDLCMLSETRLREKIQQEGELWTS